MRFSPPTQLIVFMFLSFAVVLGTMILLFRPQPSVHSAAPPSESSASFSKPLAGSVLSDTGRAVFDTSFAKGGADTARAQGDIRQLKEEVEGRLKDQMVLEEQKIAHLARLCASMTPGQAAATLSSLDDATVHRILSQLDKDAALKIQSVLVRIRKGSG